ncbi:thiomuracin/GE37468 family thiazolyl RiPP peptide [Nonomuraea aurantiaca]|uniref:thiomuracin/GE37468 family thiazolyl RiPP peptide n=2 Tax=Nonomuraea TaxID=83681 RepID=UPI001CD97D7D|nr:thiomuracin/GE37468 family thiazolyl RiPP peptide [Nonomuraea aurantiaca]MCA2225179.1 GE37468 family thiazolyl peptide [Nonomuraea aurantiaca]
MMHGYGSHDFLPRKAEKKMSISQKLDFDLKNLPMDVFDLADSGLAIESLTAGHGMAENGASVLCPSVCSTSTSSTSSSSS